MFFNNFLPSNIGGDVIRIGDTAARPASKTLATTVVLVDRIIGLMALVLVAAVGATLAAESAATGRVADLAVVAVGRLPASARSCRRRPCWRRPAFGRLLQPLTRVPSRSGSASASRS